MDRTVDPAAARELLVRGVDDRVDLLAREVTADELDHFFGACVTTNFVLTVAW